MLISRTGLLAVLAVAGLWAAGTAKAAEPTPAEQTAKVVEQLALAANLTAFGRGELAAATGLKDLKSPAALVAAGGILLRIHKQTAGQVKTPEAKVVDDGGQPIADEKTAVSFADEAAALFDEARAMDAQNQAGLEAQIKQAETVSERGAVGGPKVISRTVRSGKSQHVTLSFEPNAPASIVMRGSGGVQFEVVGPGGKVLWHSQGSWGYYNFHTGRAADRGITIRVSNNAGPPVAYTITTN